MKQQKYTDGFLLLDAVISLFIISVLIIEILIFTVNASDSVMKTNLKTRKSIEKRNKTAATLFQKSE